MKHSFKRLLSLVIALAMVLSCVPVQAFAEDCAHEYETVITGPSCTEPGSVVHTCGLCGDTYEEAGEEPAGHDYTVDEVAATCLEDGLVNYVCTVCGECETETGEAALGHSYVDGACEACGEADPEAEEPAEEPEEVFEEVTSAPAETGQTTSTDEDGGEIELPDEEPVESAVAQLGEAGKTFTTLEEAIAAAAAIPMNERPFVSLLMDCTVSETIVIDAPINIFYIGGDGNNPTIMAAEGVDTLFEITENGELMVNDVDMVTPGDYIINITGNNATFMAVNCNLSGGDEAAINVADDVNWSYPPTENWIPITIQVYNSTVSGRTALHMGGSNASATFAPGQNPDGVVELMADNPDGVIVIDGDGHDVQLYEAAISTKAGNCFAFSMNGDSVVRIGGSFNGTNFHDPWGNPMPQSGAVARLDNAYYSSLKRAFDAASEVHYESQEGEDTSEWRIPLTVLEELTIRDTLTLERTQFPVNLRGKDITLAEDGAINVVDGGILNLENQIMVQGGELFIPDGGALNVVGGTLELTGDSMTTIQGDVTLDGDSTLTLTDDAQIEVGTRGYLEVDTATELGDITKGAVRVFLPGGETKNIPMGVMNGIYLVYEADKLKAAADSFVEGGDAYEYGMKEISPYNSMTMTESVTIPEDVWMYLFVREENVVLTIPEGVTLTNNGTLEVGNDCGIEIQANGALINNNKLIKNGWIDVQEGAEFSDNGTTHAPVDLDELKFRIQDAIDRNERELWLNEDAVLAGDLDIPDYFNIFTDFGTTITVPQGEELHLGGKSVNLNGSELRIEGELYVNSALYINNGSYVIVEAGGSMNVNHSLHVGTHKEDHVEDYAGVVDVVGTLNACGYVFVEGSGLNGGVLNIYGTMNQVKDDYTEGRYGLLDINGEVFVGAYGVLDLSEIPEGMNSISVNWSGSLVVEETPEGEEYHKGTITVPNKGTVTTDAANNPRIDGIDPSYMIGSIYGGENAEELENAMAIAGESVGTYYDVRVNLWDSTIELDRNITIPEGVALILNNSGDGYYEELLIPEGLKLINNSTIVLNEETALRIFGELENNGVIILEQWASMVNYGTISGTKGKDGIIGEDYAEGTMSQTDLESELSELPGGGWIHESITRLERNMTVDLGIKEFEDGSSDERKLWISKYGQIIVPNGVTLTLNSPVSLNGGQIIVENGGKLVVNNKLHIGSGTLYLESGADMGGSWEPGPMGPITWQHDEKHDHITAYNIMENWLDNENFELYETIDDWEHGFHMERQILPGYGHRLIFYFNHWNETDKIWERTPIHPEDLSVTNGLELYSLQEDLDFQIQRGQRNGDCFVSVRVPYDERLWDTKQCVCYGEHSFPVYVQRDQDMGFYSSTEASNETFLDSFGFAPDMENSFYFIITDPYLTGLKFYAELEAGPEVVRGGVYYEKIADNVWKLTLAEDVTKHMDRNFWLRVQAEVQDPQGHKWNISRGTNCQPWIWMRGMPDAVLEFNNEEYRYYSMADKWLVNRQMEDGNWSEFDVELPEGVSYDLESNTLTLNNAHLETLNINYHWINEREGTEGYNLPHSNLTIELIGENTIIDNDHVALGLREELNATIVGNGSLFVKNSNNPGRMYNYNAADVHRSNLTIGGSADVTFAVEGQNYLEGNRPATMTALEGWEAELTITDSAKLSIEVPDLRFDEINGEGFSYRGMANFDNVTVEKRATLNVDGLRLYEGQTFTQNGGTVNICDPGTFVYDDYKNEDANGHRYWYEHVEAQNGSSVNINGGKMNLALADRDNSNAYYNAFKIGNGSTLKITGGQIDIATQNARGNALRIANDSELFIVGGNMTWTDGSNYDGEDPHQSKFLNMDGNCKAIFSGGTINVTGGWFHMEAFDENAPAIQWTGTNLIAKNTVIDQNGSFKMTGGKMQLTNSRFHANNNTTFAGGTMDMNNSVLIANGYTAVEGVAKLDFDMTDAFYTEAGFMDNCAIEVNKYLPISGFANIDIDADFDTTENKFAGIRNYSSYHQMGGTVSIDSNADHPVFCSNGNIMLNTGTMNLNGVGGIQQDPNKAENEDEKNFFDMWEGFALNVEAAYMGLELRTNSSIQGGNLNINVTAPAGSEAYGVYVSNDAMLEITGGIHEIKAVSDTYGIGLVADLATVTISEAPLVTIEGPWAMYNRISEQNGNKTITAVNTELNWTENTGTENKYGYILANANNEPVTSIQINAAPQSLKDAIAEQGLYLSSGVYVVEEDMTLADADGNPVRLDVVMNAKIIVRDGVTLTIPEGTQLLLVNGGSVIVEADSKVENNGVIANIRGAAGNGGAFIMQNSDNYIHGENAAFVTEFNESGIFRTVGVPEQYQEMEGNVESQERLEEVLTEAQKSYRYVGIWTPSSLDLSDLHIPANTSLAIDGQEETAVLTLNEGTELHIDGELYLGNVDFTVNGQLSNYGYIQTDNNDAAQITVNGKIENRGEFNLNNAKLDINNVVDNVGFMAVNNDSMVNVDGMFVDYGNLWVGIEGVGTVDVYGELNVHQRMKVYENGTVNVNAGAALRVCNYCEDGMNYNDSHLDVYGTVNVAGSLENSNALDLYGTVNVNAGGTLINDNEIWMQDTDTQSGAKLIVDGGSFVNNLSLYNASYGGIVDVSKGNFSNKSPDDDDPYGAEILTRYFEGGEIAAMNGIGNDMITLCYEGASTVAADAMARRAETDGYLNSLFRVDGVASVAIGQQLTVDFIVMLSGSQLGVNGGLTANSMLYMRADTVMTISPIGYVNTNGALRVDPADDVNGLGAAVLNNKGILECGAYGYLDICGEYNDSGVGKIYTNMEPTNGNEGYHVGSFAENTEFSEDDAILVINADYGWQVRDLLAWVMEYGYCGGLIRIDSDVGIMGDLYIPENVSVEISESGYLSVMNGQLINNGVIFVDDNDCALNVWDYTGNGTFNGYCGNDEAPKSMTWTIKNSNLTISGSGTMGNYGEDSEMYAPWRNFVNNITKIVLGSDVTNIGGGAFSCFNATMTIPETVTHFGEGPFGNCTLKIYHESPADGSAAVEQHKGYYPERVLYFHIIDPETGECEKCDYSIQKAIEDINTVLKDDAAKPEEKAEQIKNIDVEELKTIMEKSESDPEDTLVDQLDQLEQEVKNVTGLDVGIKHSDDVSEEIVDAFSNVQEDAAIVGAVLNAEEGAEEINLVIGNPEASLHEEETKDYNMDASVHFSMTMEGVSDASQLDVPVKITLPVPGSITKMNKDDLELIHYHDGSANGVNVNFNLFQDENGNWFISFVVSGFSDFLLAQKATPANLTARVYPATVTEGTNPEDVFISITAREKETNKIISGLNTSYIIRDAEGNEFDLESALNTPGTYTVEPHCLVPDAQYIVEPISVTLTVQAVEYSCVNGDEKYESVTEALTAAESGDVIRLIEDVTETVEVLIVRAGTTLDLNGHYIKAANVLGFGTIMDSKGDTIADPELEGDVPSAVDDGTETGGIINGRSNAEFVKLDSENGDYIPIYDTVTGSYKFYLEMPVGKIDGADGAVIDSFAIGKASNAQSVVYGFRLLFDSREAYEVVKRSGGSGLSLILNISWTGVETFGIQYKMSDAAMPKHAASQLTTTTYKKLMTITIGGLQNVGAGNQISAVPVLTTQVGVVVDAVENTAAQVYTIPEA